MVECVQHLLFLCRTLLLHRNLGPARASFCVKTNHVLAASSREAISCMQPGEQVARKSVTPRKSYVSEKSRHQEMGEGNPDGPRRCIEASRVVWPKERSHAQVRNRPTAALIVRLL